jgi:hypothetical protein
MRLIRLQREHSAHNQDEYIGVGVYSTDYKELDRLARQTILQPFTPYLKPKKRYETLEGMGFVFVWELPRLRGQIRLFKLAYYLALGQLRIKEYEDKALSAAEREQQLSDKFHRQLIHERNRRKREAARIEAHKKYERDRTRVRRKKEKNARQLEINNRKNRQAKLEYCQARIREYSALKDLL